MMQVCAATYFRIVGHTKTGTRPRGARGLHSSGARCWPVSMVYIYIYIYAFYGRGVSPGRLPRAIPMSWTSQQCGEQTGAREQGYQECVEGGCRQGGGGAGRVWVAKLIDPAVHLDMQTCRIFASGVRWVGWGKRSGKRWGNRKCVYIYIYIYMYKYIKWPPSSSQPPFTAHPWRSE
jgi:hypothetical protein